MELQMEKNEFKTTMEVWKFLQSALNDNIETFNKINNVANSLLLKLDKASHTLNENGEYVVLKNNYTVNKNL
jgi:hypothetical protein